MIIEHIGKRDFRLFIVVVFLCFFACNQKADGENSSLQIENDEKGTTQSKVAENVGKDAEVGVLELAAMRTDLQSFTTAAALINLQETLDKTNGQFTIFAPTDDAFAEANLIITREDATNNEALKNILLQHLVSYQTTSEYWYEDMFTTLNGRRIVIHLENDIPHVNDAKFINVDIAGKGGVLHVIDKVLEPYPETAGDQVQ